MARTIKKRLLPYLHLYADLGFFRARTLINGESLERMTREYVLLELYLFGKRFEFDLYSPYYRRLDNIPHESDFLKAIREAFPFLWYQRSKS